MLYASQKHKFCWVRRQKDWENIYCRLVRQVPKFSYCATDSMEIETLIQNLGRPCFLAYKALMDRKYREIK